MPWCGACLRKCHPFRFACRAVLIVILLFLLAALYADLVGLPQGVTERVEAAFREDGYDIRLRRIRLNVLKGIVAEGLELYGAPRDRYPSLLAGEVILLWNPLDWLHERQALTGMRIRDGLFRLSTLGYLYDETSPYNLTLKDVSADIAVESAGYRVADLSANANGILVTGKGIIVRDKRGDGDGKKRLLLRPETVTRILENNVHWIPRVSTQIHNMEIRGRAEAKLDFIIHTTNTLANELSFDAHGGDTLVRGLSFDEWRVEARLLGTRLQVPVIEAAKGGSIVSVSGQVDLADQQLEAHVFSSLPAIYLTGLIPAAWRNHIEQSGLLFAGGTKAELWIGPAAISESWRTMRGWLSVDSAEVRGVWIDKAFASLSLAGEHFEIDKVDALIGRDRNSGRLTGSAQYNLATKEFAGVGRSSFAPVAVTSLLPPQIKEVCRSMEFVQEPPSGDWKFGGVIGNPETLLLEAKASGRNFVYNGSYVSNCWAVLSVSNRVFSLRPVHVERSDGSAEGTVAIDYRNGRVTFDAVSGVDPKSLARMITPVLEKVVRPFRCEGPVEIKAAGTVDYRSREGTDFRVDVKARDFGMQWFLAEECEFTCFGVGTTVTVNCIQGSLYGGSFTGKVDIVWDDAASNATGEVLAVWKGVDFSDFSRNIRQVDDDSHRGKLSGWANVKGLLEVNRTDTITGRGRVKIEDGYLFKIPLFGGLSRLLEKIYLGGLSFSSPSNFKASFDIADRTITTEDIEVAGRLMYIEGVGNCHFNQDLDFIFKVKPLGDNVLAETFRLLTYPISSLLRFQLTGSLNVPKWSPVNWPKEMLKVFETSEPGVVRGE
ncbi:MAG: AsmA-like C-terminal region-containing protein [Verrucomicrobia bacterium]|nr:AsmA-like C-terminal region-containing protein [Verrucomicrobiota bacterium]